MRLFLHSLLCLFLMFAYGFGFMRLGRLSSRQTMSVRYIRQTRKVPPRKQVIATKTCDDAQGNQFGNSVGKFLLSTHVLSSNTVAYLVIVQNTTRRKTINTTAVKEQVTALLSLLGHEQFGVREVSG